MADAIQAAINDTLRVPNMVLTAHVHDYQRIERNLVKSTPTPFLVVGNGGYYNLHRLTSGPGAVDSATQAKLVGGYDKSHGYTTLSVSADSISGASYGVGLTGTAIGAAPAAAKSKGKKRPPKPPKPPANTGVSAVDKFSYPAAAQMLPKGTTVSL